MAARLLARSKTLTLARPLLLPNPSTAFDPAPSQLLDRCFRSPATGSDLPANDANCFLPNPMVSGAALASGNLWGYEQISRSNPINPMHASILALSRRFSVKAQGGAVMHHGENVGSQQHYNSTENNTMCKTISGIKVHDSSNVKDGDCSKVMAFSPLERRPKSGLGNESLKIKGMELSQRITYPLIPALIIISKTKLTTSLLIFAVYWQIYGFFREIFLDYVHHEVTRKWVLIYFKLLLLILAKETILDFDMV